MKRGVPEVVNDEFVKNKSSSGSSSMSTGSVGSSAMVVDTSAD